VSFSYGCRCRVYFLIWRVTSSFLTSETPTAAFEQPPPVIQQDPILLMPASVPEQHQQWFPTSDQAYEVANDNFWMPPEPAPDFYTGHQPQPQAYFSPPQAESDRPQVFQVQFLPPISGPPVPSRRTTPYSDSQQVLQTGGSTVMPRDQDFQRKGARYSCQWNRCGQLMRGEPGAVRTHIEDVHLGGKSSTPGKAVVCLWRGCTHGSAMQITSLGRHIAGKHLGTTLKTCDGCGHVFSRSDSRMRHFPKCKGMPNFEMHVRKRMRFNGPSATFLICFPWLIFLHPDLQMMLASTEHEAPRIPFFY